jgi:hypothetical protein
MRSRVSMHMKAKNRRTKAGQAVELVIAVHKEDAGIVREQGQALDGECVSVKRERRWPKKGPANKNDM